MSEIDAKQQAGVAKFVLAFGGGAVLLLLLMAGLCELFLVWNITEIKDVKIGNIDFVEKMLNNIVNATLPLVGVWVGAVISFYFGKANFDAASRSVHEAYSRAASPDDILKNKKIPDHMTKFDSNMLTVSSDATIQEVLEKAGEFNQKIPGIYRLPVMNGDTNVPIAYLELNDLKDKDTGKTVSEVINEDIGNVSRSSFKLISVKKTMKDASDAISDPSVCILFVTENGKPNEALLGIITAKDIAKSLTAET